MKLWLLMQDSNNGYDTFDSCVVVAETAEAARLMHPSGSDDKWDGKNWRHSDWTDSTWAAPDLVTVKEIGEAAAGIEGVVCASFNAG